MIRPGFTLLELLIGAAIASMLSILLTIALYQTNKFQVVVDDYVDTYNRAIIVEHQIRRDLTGTFIPVQAEMVQTKTGQQDEKAQKPLEKIFYGTNKENNFDVLTFITTNPLQVYWSEKTGKPKPRVARVVYRLEPDKEVKNSYALYRQDDYALEYDQYKTTGLDGKIRSYEVIDRIKSCELLYRYAVLPEQKEDEQKENKEKKIIEYKTTKDWQDLTPEQAQEQKRPPVPAFVQLKLSVWDAFYKRDKVFTFEVPIFVDTTPIQTNRSEVASPKQINNQNKINQVR